MSPAITVIGIGADGWDGLNAPTKALIEAADTVIGGARHLAMLPPSDQPRVVWPSPLKPQLEAFIAAQIGSIVVVASGDPLVSGIGTTLIDLLGAEEVEVLPAVSSVALARARMKWSAESVEVISLVGRDPHTIMRALASGQRLLVLSGDGSNPDRVAKLLVDAGYGASTLTVLADLGATSERRDEHTAATWAGPAPVLNIIAIECIGAGGFGWTAGLPDDAYDSAGQVTKRDLRASALARLVPLPGQLLWDVGAGAGSIGIEWMRAHPTCRAIAIEARHDRAERVATNATKLGVPALRIVEGIAPEALQDLEQPHAVFVGGGASIPGVLDACWAALRDGGRLVAHGVTLETEMILADWYGRFGGELVRIGVERAAPIGSFTGWTPARTVTQLSLTKES